MKEARHRFNPLLLLIRGYQLSLSYFIGRSCRHLPSCSEYMADAIKMHGTWPGVWMGAARIFRCRPGGTQGYDPVPVELPRGACWYFPTRYGVWRNPKSRRIRP